MPKIAELSEFDMAEYLTTKEEVAAYLTLVIEENDPGELAHALGMLFTNPSRMCLPLVA